LNNWHPASKLLVAVAVLAIPYLAWTSLGEAPAAVSVVQRAVPEAEPPPTPAEPPGEVTLARLPPLERFTAIVDRPLFSPSRRPPPPVETPVEEVAAPEDEPEPLPPDNAAPEVRFVGTVGQGGAMTALVVRDGQEPVIKLRVGDEVDGWRVSSVSASQLVIEHEAERLVLTILE
jgi:general secretion pathway protein N